MLADYDIFCAGRTKSSQLVVLTTPIGYSLFVHEILLASQFKVVSGSHEPSQDDFNQSVQVATPYLDPYKRACGTCQESEWSDSWIVLLKRRWLAEHEVLSSLRACFDCALCAGCKRLGGRRQSPNLKRFVKLTNGIVKSSFLG